MSPIRFAASRKRHGAALSIAVMTLLLALLADGAIIQASGRNAGEISGLNDDLTDRRRNTGVDSRSDAKRNPTAAARGGGYGVVFSREVRLPEPVPHNFSLRITCWTT